MEPLTRYRRWGSAIGAYLLFAIVVLAPVWSGRVEPKWDGLDFNYPAFAYAGEALRSGTLPLWSPYTNCGEPFIADPAYLWYQPGAALSALVHASSFDGFMTFWAAIWAWAGAGVFLLSTVLGAGPLGALMAGCSFLLSGFFVGHGQHTPYLVTGAWFPWVLALVHLAMARRDVRIAAAAGAALGLSALGGYAGLVVFEALAVALWLGLGFLLPGSGPARDLDLPLKHRLRLGAIVFGISTVLLAVIWSPTLYAFLVEAWSFTDRTKPLSDELVLNGNVFPPSAFVSFLFPSLTIVRQDLFPSDVSMTDAYVGALTIPFAAVWLAASPRRRWWVAGVVVFWLWTAVGEVGGLRTILHYVFPPTRYMRHNGMLRVLALAPLSAAAGAGFTESFREHLTLARRSVLAWMGVVTGAALLVVTLLGSDLAIIQAVAPALAVVAACAVILWLGARRWPRAAAAAIVVIIGIDLAWHLSENSFTTWNLPGSMTLRQFEAQPAADGASAFGSRGVEPPAHPSKLYLVKHVPVVEGYAALVSSDFKAMVHSRFLDVLVRQRYWLSDSSLPAPPVATGLSLLATVTAADPVPVFVSSASDVLGREPVVPGSFGRVRVVKYQPERVELEADVPAGSDAVLASTERTAPSWRVAVDGSVRPLSTVDYFFRGVRLGPGLHRVVFTYEPRAFLPLLALSYAALLGAIAVGGVALWRTRSPSPSAAATRAVVE